jgi:hypothetical protein
VNTAKKRMEPRKEECVQAFAEFGRRWRAPPHGSSSSLSIPTLPMKPGPFVILFFSMLVSVAEAETAYEPISHWVLHPDKRAPAVHLALFEVTKIVSEYVTTIDSANSKACFDGGKTWSKLQKVKAGVMTIRMIESPGVAMPQTLDVYFHLSMFVPAPETSWTNSLVQAGKRLLGLFRKDLEGKWSLQGLDSQISDPVRQLIDPNEARALQSYFMTPLASEDAVLQARRKALDDATDHARQRAGTNAPDTK